MVGTRSLICWKDERRRRSKESWGNPRPKKNLTEIAVAHGVPYVAIASVGFPFDLDKKVKKALAIRGPKYLTEKSRQVWQQDKKAAAFMGRLKKEHAEHLEELLKERQKKNPTADKDKDGTPKESEI